MINYRIETDISYQSFGELYHKANDRILPEEIFKWLYLNNPYGKAQGISAYVEGKMVGFMAYFPWEMIYKNQFFRAVQIGNLVVDPVWQRKGIFGEIKKVLESVLNTSEYKFAFGFPNDLSTIGFLKYPKSIWKESMNSFKIINFKNILSNKSLTKIPLGDLFDYSKNNNKYNFKVVERLSFDHKIIFDDRLNSNRTSDFINWRFIDCPSINANCIQISKNNEIIGYVVFSLKKNKIEVYDFYIEDSDFDIFHVLLKRLLSFTKKRLCSILYCGNDKYLPSLKIKTKFKQKVLIIPADNIDIVIENIKCHLTYLDTDFYMI